MMLRNLVIIGCLLWQVSAAGSDSSKVDFGHRKVALISATGLLSAGSLVYLNKAWYSSYGTGSFHLFNDNSEWFQMDKAGHAFTCYQGGRLMMNAMSWAGFSKKQSLAGAGFGLVYMTAIECLDGMSPGWGFSWGDMAANVAGTALVFSQAVYWKEQRVQLKFSYSESGLAKYNPALLGEGNYSILKDYNGQTYWLSVNPSAFSKGKTFMPRWLNIAFGYGAYGMLGAKDNKVWNEVGTPAPVRGRSYYLSLDVDFTRIKTRSRFLKSVFSVLNIVKIPAPTISFDKNKVNFYPLYF